MISCSPTCFEIIFYFFCLSLKAFFCFNTYQCQNDEKPWEKNGCLSMSTPLDHFLTLHNLHICISSSTHHGVVLPELVAFEVMALEHHDRSVKLGHVQTQVVRPDLLIGCVGENLQIAQGDYTFYQICCPYLSLSVNSPSWTSDTWLPPMPWQLKIPTFSFSLRAMLSRHWLVSTLRIWAKYT